ncbi:MAG: NAD-dependent epimerase/dehydratase family protein [Bacteroidales bacterium]|jgi:nucleoside-diphosphate-sugar epimerase|nr:NAD-dependent epimerase/dehydratase family protein [Bacteroidales bacterium]
MKLQTVFVTGGTGLVGSHLIFDLLQKGYGVKALVRVSSHTQQVRRVFSHYASEAAALFEKIEWIEGSLFDYAALCEQVAGCSHAYHCAAVVSFEGSGKSQLLAVNIRGTDNIVNACLAQRVPLCFVSSVGALGRSETGQAVTESDIWQSAKGRSAYSYSKFKSEMAVWRGIAEGLQAVIVNPAIILGPADREKGSSAFFSTIAKGMKFYPPGVNGFVDVRDVSRCMIRLMEEGRYGERYILSAENWSYYDLFSRIAAEMKVKAPSIPVGYRTLRVACLLAGIIAGCTGKKPLLTKETVQSSVRCNRYSSRKVEETIAFNFTPMEKTIENCCSFFGNFKWSHRE